MQSGLALRINTLFYCLLYELYRFRLPKSENKNNWFNILAHQTKNEHAMTRLSTCDRADEGKKQVWVGAEYDVVFWDSAVNEELG